MQARAISTVIILGSTPSWQDFQDGLVGRRAQAMEGWQGRQTGRLLGQARGALLRLLRCPSWTPRDLPVSPGTAAQLPRWLRYAHAHCNDDGAAVEF
jgi:hypothetical protein